MRKCAYHIAGSFFEVYMHTEGDHSDVVRVSFSTQYGANCLLVALWHFSIVRDMEKLSASDYFADDFVEPTVIRIFIAYIQHFCVMNTISWISNQGFFVSLHPSQVLNQDGACGQKVWSVYCKQSPQVPCLHNPLDIFSFFFSIFGTIFLQWMYTVAEWLPLVQRADALGYRLTYWRWKITPGFTILAFYLSPKWHRPWLW